MPTKNKNSNKQTSNQSSAGKVKAGSTAVQTKPVGDTAVILPNDPRWADLTPDEKAEQLKANYRAEMKSVRAEKRGEIKSKELEVVNETIQASIDSILENVKSLTGREIRYLMIRIKKGEDNKVKVSLTRAEATKE